MIDNYKDIIKAGMEIKNYKVLCELLQERVIAGSSRDAQHKKWQRHFSYVKSGHKYIINEVYNTPLEKEDGRYNGNNTTHGLSKTKLYGVWKSIIDRCSYPSSTFYENYGGRGITICKEWRESFVNFYNWAVENGYREDSGLSIDRIDVNGNYESSNCRWVDNKVQIINRRISKGKIINSKKRTIKKDYIIQNIDGVYLTYLIIRNRTYPVGTFFSEEESIKQIDTLYKKLVNS